MKEVSKSEAKPCRWPNVNSHKTMITTMETMENPQPFEVALIRKLKSKTKSVRDAFLLLDADGDGRISPDDVRTVTHNELGVTLTPDQMRLLASRNGDDAGGRGGMKYKEFAIYLDAVSRVVMPSSQSGMAASAGLERQESEGAEAPICDTRRRSAGDGTSCGGSCDRTRAIRPGSGPRRYFSRSTCIDRGG